jgi:hypothetical protein
MKIFVTNIDASSGIPCTDAPMRTGPALPNVKGFQYVWNDESNWPVACVNGIYQTAPKYYGTCDDDADTSITGVLGVLSDAEYSALKTAEYQARKPFPSWIGNEETMKWNSPTPYPDDGKNYYWNESSVSWIAHS